MNDKEIIKSMGYPSLEYKIMFEAMQKARQDERKNVMSEYEKQMEGAKFSVKKLEAENQSLKKELEKCKKK
jgi:predicted RNase H-like nuclease (RuvC/YqgF family)